MKIERFTPKQAEAVSRIICDNLDLMVPDVLTLEQVEVDKAYYSPDNTRRVFCGCDAEAFVALDDANAVIGSAALQKRRDSCRVMGVYVDHRQHGKGIGTALMKTVERLAGSMGYEECSFIVIKGSDAVGFYKRLESH